MLVMKEKRIGTIKKLEDLLKKAALDGNGLYPLEHSGHTLEEIEQATRNIINNGEDVTGFVAFRRYWIIRANDIKQYESELDDLLERSAEKGCMDARYYLAKEDLNNPRSLPWLLELHKNNYYAATLTLLNIAKTPNSGLTSEQLIEVLDGAAKSKSPHVLAGLAEYYKSQKNLTEGIRVLESIHRDHAQEYFCWSELGEFYFENGQYKESIKFYSDVKATENSSLNAMNQLRTYGRFLKNTKEENIFNYLSKCNGTFYGEKLLKYDQVFVEFRTKVEDRLRMFLLTAIEQGQPKEEDYVTLRADIRALAAESQLQFEHSKNEKIDVLMYLAIVAVAAVAINIALALLLPSAVWITAAVTVVAASIGVLGIMGFRAAKAAYEGSPIIPSHLFFGTPKTQELAQGIVDRVEVMELNALK